MQKFSKPRAKSRLHIPTQKTPPASTSQMEFLVVSKLLKRFQSVGTQSVSLFNRKIHAKHTKNLTDANVQSWLVLKSRSLVLLGLSLAALVLLLTKVSPTKVADLGLAQTYLPLLAVIFILFFSLCRLLFSFRYALYIGIGTTALVFIQVHQVIFAASYALIPLFVVGLSELLIVLAKKR